MARPKTDPHGVSTKDRILKAAEDAFSADGFNGTRLDDIAKRVGIRSPSLLYHFESKEKIYEEVIQRVMTDLGMALIGPLSLEGTYEERFTELVNTYLEFLRVRPAFPRLLLREIMDGIGPGQAMLYAVAEPLLADIGLFIRQFGAPQSIEDLPVRQAVLHVAMAACVQHAAAPGIKGLWGFEDQTLDLAKRLFIPNPDEV